MVMPEDKEKNPVGRPTKYNPDFHPSEARKLAELDFTDLQIAQSFGISEATLYNWKKQYLEFLEAIQEGKQGRIKKVEKAALKVALGYYEHEYEFDPNDPLFKGVGDDVKELVKKALAQIPKKYYKPDPKVLMLMMMSLSDKYKMKTEETVVDPLREKLNNMTSEEMDKRIKELEKKRSKKDDE